jgi:predicted enzyme related to lactoylglutathione lyase
VDQLGRHRADLGVAARRVEGDEDEATRTVRSGGERLGECGHEPVGVAAGDGRRGPASFEHGHRFVVARPGGVSYLAIPVHDVSASAHFYQAVFGWELRGDLDRPSFADGTGHVIGHWRTDLTVAGESGIRPYVYVDDLEQTLGAATDLGAKTTTTPYWQGSLRIAAIEDPAGNVIGVWTQNPPRGR